MNKQTVLTIIGTICLVAGCFCPVMIVAGDKIYLFSSLPFTISNIPANALKYAAGVIILTSLISVALALLGQEKWLWITGTLSCIFILSLYYGIQAKIESMKIESNHQLSVFGGLFKELTETIFSMVKLGGLGWYIMGTGALILFLSSLLNLRFIKHNL